MNIENKKQLTIILLAVGLGLVAALLTSQYVKNSVREQTKQLAAQYDKKAAATKTALVKELEMRDKELKKRMDQMAKEVKDMPKKAVREGTTDTTIFSVRTPPGKRAFTIKIDSLSAVGGLINPGDFIDIIGHIKIPKKSDSKSDTREVTSVLFQDVQVLAVGVSFNPTGDAQNYETQQKTKSLNVTLAVDPTEAGLLTFAQNHGRLEMSLRSPSEQGAKPLTTASWESLSDYVLERQGTELMVPHTRAPVQTIRQPGVESMDEVEPYIQIFRGGREL